LLPLKIATSEGQVHTVSRPDALIANRIGAIAFLTGTKASRGDGARAGPVRGSPRLDRSCRVDPVYVDPALEVPTSVESAQFSLWDVTGSISQTAGFLIFTRFWFCPGSVHASSRFLTCVKKHEQNGIH
jgi:hypothetical protein